MTSKAAPSMDADLEPEAIGTYYAHHEENLMSQKIDESPKKRPAENDAFIEMAANDDDGEKKPQAMDVDTGAAADDNAGPKRKSWDVRFAELKKYRQEHGDCLVPQKYAANPKLGRW